MKIILTTDGGKVIDTIEHVELLNLLTIDCATSLAVDLDYSIRAIGRFMEEAEKKPAPQPESKE